MGGPSRVATLVGYLQAIQNGPYGTRHPRPGLSHRGKFICIQDPGSSGEVSRRPSLLSSNCGQARWETYRPAGSLGIWNPTPCGLRDRRPLSGRLSLSSVTDCRRVLILPP